MTDLGDMIVIIGRRIMAIVVIVAVEGEGNEVGGDKAEVGGEAEVVAMDKTAISVLSEIRGGPGSREMRGKTGHRGETAFVYFLFLKSLLYLKVLYLSDFILAFSLPCCILT